MGASHHGGANDRDPAQEALMKRFMDQVEARAKRGCPRGRIGETDDGSLALAVAADPARGIVRVDFGKAVEWLCLPPKEAVGLARLLIAKAREVSAEPLTVEL